MFKSTWNKLKEVTTTNKAQFIGAVKCDSLNEVQEAIDKLPATTLPELFDRVGTIKSKHIDWNYIDDEGTEHNSRLDIKGRVWQYKDYFIVEDWNYIVYRFDTLVEDEVEETKEPKQDKELIVIEDTINSFKDSKHIDTTLQQIDKNKAKIKELNNENKTLIKDVFPLINAMIKDMREENEVFAKASKKVVATVLKTRLGSSNPLVTLALTLNIEGLNIDNTMSISSIKTLLKMFTEGEISKSSINKSDKETLEDDIKKYKEDTKLLKAIELVSNSEPIEENYVELTSAA